MSGRAVHRRRAVGPGAALACAAPAAPLSSRCRGGAPPPARPPPAHPPPAASPADEPRPHVVLHTVRRGETLWRIARAYGADVEEMIVVNNLEGSARIEAGQTLL